MTAPLLFIALTIAIFAPRGIKSSGWRRGRARDAAAFALALFSACALPWSGVSLLRPLGLGSEAWLPFWAAAVVIAPKGQRAGYGGRAILAVSVIAFEAAMSRYMSETGIPGRMFSVEGFSMILRLCPLAVAIAMCLAAAGLSLSFVSLERGGAAFRLIGFSFSGFLSMIFMPLDFLAFGRLSPRLLALLQPCSLFILSGVLSRLFVKGEALPGSGRWRKFALVALTAAGCLLLATQ
ncbi:MAG: hypothetical protein LBF92_06075 [Synergistaceae bacterium]|jgi:hypothetical protein|nr:hypothetical protein [Synergistaceae bacterium]